MPVSRKKPAPKKRKKSTNGSRPKAKVRSPGNAVKSREIPQVITQDNELINACYKMTLNEKRLLTLAMTKINPRKLPRRSTPHEIDITIGEWQKHFPSHSRAAYKEIQQASRRLLRRQVTIKGRTPNYQVFNWLDRCDYVPGESRVRIVFGYTVSLYLGGFHEQFTKIDLIQARQLRSFHAIRIYELLSQYRTTGIRIQSLAELRDILGLRDAYPLYADLKRRVIDPSIKEINEKTDTYIDWVPVKKGKRVDSIKFLVEHQAQQNLKL